MRENELSIGFKLEGNEMNGQVGYDLYYLSNNLNAFNQLLESTFNVLNDNKLLKKDQLKIRIKNVREGSFVADIYLELSMIVGSLLPLTSEINPKTIWDMTKMSFEFLKTILEANRRGESMSTNVIDSTNVNVVNGDGATIINVHPDVLRVASETYPAFKRISSLIDEKNGSLTKAVFKDNTSDNLDIEIGEYEKELFTNKPRLEEKTLKLQGRIIKAHAEKHNGVLRVYENDFIPSGEYNFEFINKEDYSMKDYFDIDCTFLVLKLIQFKPESLESTIKQLKIISVKN